MAVYMFSDMLDALNAIPLSPTQPSVQSVCTSSNTATRSPKRSSPDRVTVLPYQRKNKYNRSEQV